MSEYSKGLRIVTRLGERCTAVPLQVLGSDKTKLEVHGGQRAVTGQGTRSMTV